MLSGSGRGGSRSGSPFRERLCRAAIGVGVERVPAPRVCLECSPLPTTCE